MYGFTGEIADSNTGLVYLRARYYAPGQGRFMTRDTWGGSLRRPMSYNKWLYVYANPILWIDPTGWDCGFATPTPPGYPCPISTPVGVPTPGQYATPRPPDPTLTTFTRPTLPLGSGKGFFAAHNTTSSLLVIANTCIYPEYQYTLLNQGEPWWSVLRFVRDFSRTYIEATGGSNLTEGAVLVPLPNGIFLPASFGSSVNYSRRRYNGEQEVDVATSNILYLNAGLPKGKGASIGGEATFDGSLSSLGGKAELGILSAGLRANLNNGMIDFWGVYMPGTEHGITVDPLWEKFIAVKDDVLEKRGGYEGIRARYAQSYRYDKVTLRTPNFSDVSREYGIIPIAR